jgi:membrane protease subunit HflK
MSWDNNSNNDDKKNPWGQKPSSSSHSQSPWGKPTGGRGGKGGGGGNRGGGNGGDSPPDLDEMLKRAQDNLRQVVPNGMGNGRLIGLGAVALVALWLSSGFYIIEPGTNAVIQRFGAVNRTQVNEGLGYRLPWPFETATKVSVSEVRSMHLTPKSANRMRGDVSNDSLMLTSDANIVDLDLIVQWNIKSADDYIFNIRDPQSTLQKVAESAIREVVGQTPMFSIITNERVAVAERAKQIMAANLDAYKSGINITQVLINEAEVHPDVQAAFQDVQSAKQDAFDVQNRAQAYREDILPKARGLAIKMVQEATGYRDSAVARATGDAERFNSVLDAYQTGKDVTRQRMYLETMQNVLGNAQTIIIDDAVGKSGVVPYLPLNELKPSAGSSTSPSVPNAPQNNISTKSVTE